ncbi:MAG TPA: polyphosphate polymerase domain-containing protein [Clostridia bacterium]|nr:MAG: VTC domain protein [Firmicutes bacterium ADurb.Bin248]HOG00643.1 polyphosphate polymerase domain-containing protein [Clostridia bacterium]HOS18595.1 polyphosphate polymerase domain-containing protein [Clostridia bacterium]HPK14674.1 polyphosphate polymerase domain-containing protein [Clostridia bacterium]
MSAKAQSGYRHELKYYINQGDYTLLRRKLSLTMEQDRNAAKNGGEYFIRSLYFDDADDSAFREKLDGDDSRDKFRIRIYNMRDDAIKLECKHKESTYIRKHSLMLCRAEYETLRRGDYTFLLRRPEPFARRMFAEFSLRPLRPVVLVDYAREAYVFPVEDVRVTFDKNVRTGYRSTALFDPNVPTFPVVDGYDMVLEVKFNRYLPTYIRALLQIDSHARSAISKYALCRKFEL